MDKAEVMELLFLAGQKYWMFPNYEETWADDFDWTGITYEEFDVWAKEASSLRTVLYEPFIASFTQHIDDPKLIQFLESIYFDGETWNDFFWNLYTLDDFDEFWETNWLTRDDFSGEELNPDVFDDSFSLEDGVQLFKVQLFGWFKGSGKQSLFDYYWEISLPFRQQLELLH